MSRVHDLIAELCPDGVEFKVLSEICNVYDGTHQTPKYTDSGVKFVSVENISQLYRSQKYISEQDFNKNYKIRPRTNDVFMTRIGSIGACAVIENDEPLAYYVTLALLRPDPSTLNSNYLKCIIESGIGAAELRKRTLVNATPIKINLGEIGKIKIPVPPLEVQQELVEVLTQFTKLEAELKVELKAELEARLHQYKYYRERLLISDPRISRSPLTLGDVGKISMCKRIFKGETSADGQIPFYKIGTFGGTPDAFIDRELYDAYKKRFSFPKKGDILISAAGTIGKPVVYDGQPAYFQDSNIVWIDNDESKVANKYLYYLYQVIKWDTDGGTIQRLYNDKIRRAKIAIPSLAEQSRIVEMLDRYEALVGELSAGLPAEILARRQQLEYYRDRLLTFKEAV